MGDKNADKILQELSQLTNQLILTRIDNEREYSYNKLFNISGKYFDEIDLTKDINNALKLTEGYDCLIVGSFYLAGKFLEIYKNSRNY